MDKNNVLTLTMESEAFNGLKTDFNQVLRRTLTNMERKESEQAELTVKLKISLEKDTAPDFREVKGKAERDIVRPTFTHKISSVMQIKCEKSGVLSGDYELVWDEERGDYIMRPIDDGQLSLFDENGKPAEPLCLEAGTPETTEPLAIEGEISENASEANDEQDAIEADYRVVDEEENSSDDYDYEEHEEASDE